jgi:hypothetical protein
MPVGLLKKNQGVKKLRINEIQGAFQGRRHINGQILGNNH